MWAVFTQSLDPRPEFRLGKPGRKKTQSLTRSFQPGMCSPRSFIKMSNLTVPFWKPGTVVSLEHDWSITLRKGPCWLSMIPDRSTCSAFFSSPCKICRPCCNLSSTVTFIIHFNMYNTRQLSYGYLNSAVPKLGKNRKFNRTLHSQNGPINELWSALGR